MLTSADSLIQRLKEGDREREERLRRARIETQKAKMGEEKKKRQRAIRKTVERRWAIFVHRFLIAASGLRYQVMEKQRKAKERQEELKRQAELQQMEARRRAATLLRRQETEEERRLEQLMKEWSLEPSEAAFRENWREYLEDERRRH